MTEAVIITGRRLSKKQLNVLCPSTIRPPRTNLAPIVPPQASSFISPNQLQDQVNLIYLQDVLKHELKLQLEDIFGKNYSLLEK